jgi:hypothetical protein
MRRAAYWLFPLIAFAVALFIALFLVQINPSTPSLIPIQKDDENDPSEGLKGKIGNWLSHFSQKEESGYFYPVNEVTLYLDMGGKHPLSDVYRVTINPQNSDEHLQVIEELKKSTLPYVMEKNEKMGQITVDSTDQSHLQSLVTKLKTYQITVTLAPLTEEK